MLCRPRWKNSVVDVQTDHAFWQHSSHYPLIAKFRVKLKHIHPVHVHRPAYADPLVTQEYTRFMEERLEAWPELEATGTWEDLAPIIMEVRDQFPTANSTIWRPYITEPTQALINA